jgi:hypothetical protein
MTNSHWQYWCEAVERTGYCSALKIAAERLRVLDSMSVEEIESLFRAAQIMESGEFEPLRFVYKGEPVITSPFSVMGCEFLQ